jgi:hypothetical protein
MNSSAGRAWDAAGTADASIHETLAVGCTPALRDAWRSLERRYDGRRCERLWGRGESDRRLLRVAGGYWPHECEFNTEKWEYK